MDDRIVRPADNLLTPLRAPRQLWISTISTDLSECIEDR